MPENINIEGFQIIKKIGEGTRSLAFKAIQEKFNREVVIKLLNSPLDTEEQEQFLDEANKITQLNYPNIAVVFDADFFFDANRNKIPFIVMEYIEGTPLINSIDIIKKNTLSQNLSIFLEIVKAISYSHEKEVSHCDLHPNNILLVPFKNSLIAKIIDFGLSKNSTNFTDPFQRDLEYLKELLSNFFFFPKVIPILENLLAQDSIDELLYTLTELLNIKFYDELVNRNLAYREGDSVEDWMVSEKNIPTDLTAMFLPIAKGTETKLYMTMFCFVKEFHYSKGFKLNFERLFHSDMYWDASGELIEISIFNRITHGEYSTFLLLISLTEILFKYENSQSLINYCSSDLVDNDRINYLIRQLDYHQFTNFIYKNGFLHHDVRIGMQKFLVRQLDVPKLGHRKVTDENGIELDIDLSLLKEEELNKLLTKKGVRISTPILKLNGVDTAIYNSLLQKFRMPKLEIKRNDNKIEIESVSNIFSQLNWEKTIESGYITVILTGIERTFFSSKDIYCIYKSKIIKPSIINLPNYVKLSILIDSNNFSKFSVQIMVNQKIVVHENCTIDYLIQAYACCLMERNLRFPTSQYYRLGEANIIAVIGEGAYFCINNKAIIQKGDEKNHFISQFIKEIELYFQVNRSALKAVSELYKLMLSNLENFYNFHTFGLNTLRDKYLESVPFETLQQFGFLSYMKLDDKEFFAPWKEQALLSFKNHMESLGYSS